MTPLILFIISLFALLIMLSFIFFGSVESIKAFYRKPGNKNIVGGIKAFVGFGVIVSVIFFTIDYVRADTRYFSFAEVYLGVDTLGSTSPQCEEGDNDRLTSNGGLRGNFMQYTQNKLTFELNGKYTHHSGAFCVDNHIYDGVGIESVFRISR